ncbi:MAG: flagellar biosynthetic protein FliQ [Planctomycetota bacterium]
MLDDSALELLRTALIITLKVSAPMLVAGIAIGLLVAIVQSLTSIQEQTLALVPKIFAMVIVMIALLRWMFVLIADFTVEMFSIG